MYFMLGGKEFETVGVCMGSSASSTTTVGPVAVGVVVDGCARRDVVSFTSSYVIDGLARDNLLFCVSSVSPIPMPVDAHLSCFSLVLASNKPRRLQEAKRSDTLM